MADNEKILQSEENAEVQEGQTETVQSEKSAPKKSKFFTPDVIKCIVVLAVIALVSGILLGVMNWLTYVDPDETIMKEVNAVYTEADTIEKAESVTCNYESGSVNSLFVAYKTEGESKNLVGYCFYSVGKGAKDGTLELLVYIDAEGIIKDVVVYSQNETAGYFKKVESANKDKYVGLDVDDIDALVLKSSKFSGQLASGEVTAVSGATRTSTGYHNAVCAAVDAYKNCKEA